MIYRSYIEYIDNKTYEKYTEILESPNFKAVYQSTRYICRNTTNVCNVKFTKKYSNQIDGYEYQFGRGWRKGFTFYGYQYVEIRK